MSKELEVYNAYFGDCIILKDTSDDTNLLVDFGIHNCTSIPSAYTDRDTLTGIIADDIANKYASRNLSLLITHFHTDHISGLIYMFNNQMKNPNYKGLFENVYLANIWHNPFAVASYLLEGWILETELKKSGLPGTSASLMDLLDFLQDYSRKITLLSKGETFENDKYITLWPPKDEKKLTNIISSLDLPEDLERSLLELAEMMCVFVVVQRANGDRTYEVRYIEYNRDYPIAIEDIRNKYDNVSENLEEYLNSDESKKIELRKLNKLNHKYNIVFQNKEFCDENVLFTGDVEKTHMRKIAKATDIALYPNYKFIKIPHHGTDYHYFDFSGYSPKNVIITNGKVNKADSYKISARYGTLNAHFICANSNFCCNCNFTCASPATGSETCLTDHELIYSRRFKHIK